MFFCSSLFRQKQVFEINSKKKKKELLRTTQRVQDCLGRCLSSYGDLSSYGPKHVEEVYVAIVKHEERISKLEKGKSFARIITQSRLRSKIDKTSNSICVMVRQKQRMQFFLTWLVMTKPTFSITKKNSKGWKTGTNAQGIQIVSNCHSQHGRI